METLERLLAAGRTREARAQAQKRLKAKPNDRDALLALVKVELMLGELQSAQQKLERLEKQGETVDTVVARANLAVQGGDGKKARSLFEKAVGMRPERAEAFFGLGVVLAAGDEYQASLPMFERAVALAPGQGVFHYHLAQNLLALERPEDAARHGTLAVERNPAYPPAYLLLSRMLGVVGRLEDARAVLKEGLRLLPSDPRLMAALTNVNLVGGDVGGAFQAAATLAKDHPADPAAMCNLASLLLAQNRLPEVLEICRGMESMGKATAPLKCLEATVYEAQKPLDQAKVIKTYERAMALDASDWVSANNLGQFLMRMKDEALVPRAIEVLEQATKRKPDQLEPVLNLALAYARHNDVKKARELASRLLDVKLPATSPLRRQAEKLLAALGKLKH